MPSDLQLSESIQALTAKEAHALKYFTQAKHLELSPQKAGELYELYANGKDCEEIRRLNPGLGLGQIVHARIRDDWDQKKNEHQQKLFENAAPRVMQVQLETSQYLADMLAAAVKLNWDKVKMYLQDGNTNHLKGTPLEEGVSIKKLTEIIATLQQVTGQDKKKVVEHRGGVTVSHSKSKMTQDEAAALLEAMAEEAARKG